MFGDGVCDWILYQPVLCCLESVVYVDVCVYVCMFGPNAVWTVKNWRLKGNWHLSAFKTMLMLLFQEDKYMWPFSSRYKNTFKVDLIEKLKMANGSLPYLV